MKMPWPELDYKAAKETYDTLHLWTQIVGKIKLSKLPWVNHSWHVTLTVTPSGLSTSAIITENENFQIDFDLINHQLEIICGSGEKRGFALQGLSVAEFYYQVKDSLAELDIEININEMPNEIQNAISFPQDHEHKTYELNHAEALHKALINSQAALLNFRAKFNGKCSPIHFFWGSFDLAVSRFSGRSAPMHPGGVPNLPDRVAQEAYSHEVSSAGFWPGNEMVPFAAFYSYIYPEPAGFKEAKISPAEAYYDKTLGEYILPYAVVQQAENPGEILMQFLQTTYEAAANAAHWDREMLE
ncbi:MAG: hypothetical protein EOP53_05375 [Sphingobacteriales bacterium]|nr:MAG: hypothetical protein EOP53_05375 [Sphingobacteriales bacterium]